MHRVHTYPEQEQEGLGQELSPDNLRKTTEISCPLYKLNAISVRYNIVDWFSCKPEYLDTVIISSLHNFFANALHFGDALDKGHKLCSELLSIGAAVRILSFRRCWCVRIDKMFT